MTVKKIIVDYLKQNGYDGLHCHAVDNNLGGCGCSINNLFHCGESCEDCEPAYKHIKRECKKCPDSEKCEAFEYGEKHMYCGKKKV